MLRKILKNRKAYLSLSGLLEVNKIDSSNFDSTRNHEIPKVVKKKVVLSVDI